MSGVPLETCWTFKKLRNNKFCYKAASCLYLYWVIYDARIHEYLMPKLLLRIWNFEYHGTAVSRNVASRWPVTQRRIPQERNRQLPCCENVRSSHRWTIILVATTSFYRVNVTGIKRNRGFRRGLCGGQFSLFETKVKVKVSSYRPVQTLRAPGVWDSQNF